MPGLHPGGGSGGGGGCPPGTSLLVIGHMAIETTQSGSMRCSQSVGRMISSLGPRRS